jgi:hypothetical protein
VLAYAVLEAGSHSSGRKKFKALWDALHEPMKREREATYRAHQSGARLAADAKWASSAEGKAPIAAEDARRAAEADDVADAVVFEFMVDELTHQWCELAIAARVMRPGPLPGLCRVRPLAGV